MSDYTVDVACPGDNRIAEKEEEKMQRYDLLKREIKRLWHMKNIDIIPIFVGALESITTELDKRIEQLNIEIAIEKLQKRLFWEQLEFFAKYWKLRLE